MFDSDRSSMHIVVTGLLASLMMSPAKFVSARDVEIPSVTLQYLRPELDTPQGVVRLYRRIRAAAATVCSPYDIALFEEKQKWDQCVQQAVSRAVADAHSERLTAYHWSHIGQRERHVMEAPTAVVAR